MSATQNTFDPNTAVIEVDDGAITFKWSELPPVSQFRAAKGGIAHMLQNEVASQVVGRIRKELGHNAKTNPVSKEQVQAFRANNADVVNGWDAEFTAEKVKAIREGTLMDRAITTREPARSPVDRLALELMGNAVESAFTKHQAKLATLGQTFTWSAKDRLAKVKEMASVESTMAKYRTQAQAVLATQDEDDDVQIAA
jgi:hypothetical protein